MNQNSGGLLVCGKWLTKSTKPQTDSANHLINLPTIFDRSKKIKKAKAKHGQTNEEKECKIPITPQQNPPDDEKRGSKSRIPCQVEEWQDYETGEIGYYFPAFDTLCNLKGEPIMYNVKKQQFIHQLFAERMNPHSSSTPSVSGPLITEPDDAIRSMGVELDHLHENVELLEGFEAMFDKLQMYENMKLSLYGTQSGNHQSQDQMTVEIRKRRAGRPLGTGRTSHLPKSLKKDSRPEKETKVKNLSIPQHLKPYAIRENLVAYHFPALEDIPNAFDREYTSQEMSDIFDRFQQMHPTMEYIWYPYGWQFIDKANKKPVDYVCKFIKEEQDREKETSVCRIKRNFIVTWYEKLPVQVINPTTNQTEDAFEKRQCNFDKKNKEAALFFCKKVGILYNTVFGQIPAQLFRSFGIKVYLNGTFETDSPQENKFTYFVPWKLYCRRVPSNPKKNYVAIDQQQESLCLPESKPPLMIGEKQDHFLRSSNQIQDLNTPSFVPPQPMMLEMFEPELLESDPLLIAKPKVIPTMEELDNLPCRECGCVCWMVDLTTTGNQNGASLHQYICSDCFVATVDLDSEFCRSESSLHPFYLDTQYPQFKTKACSHESNETCANCIYYTTNE